MPIYLLCPKCKKGNSTKAKKCSCDHEFLAKGRKYRVVVSHSGTRSTKVCDNLSLARKLEKKWNGQIVAGDYNLKKEKVLTLNQWWGEYLPIIKETKKSWHTDEIIYNKHLKPVFGNKRLDNISSFAIQGLIRKMKKSKSVRGKLYSTATVKHVVVLLKRLYNYAIKHNKYTGVNPCNAIEFKTELKLDNKRVAFLQDDELVRLLGVLDDLDNKMHSCFFKFLLFTGMRRGELFKLKWSSVDLSRQTIKIIDPKGKKDVVLPLSDNAVAVLREVPKEYDSEYIFYGRDGKKRTYLNYNVWDKIKKDADLPDAFRIHDLRHHFASALVSNGTDLYTVSQLLTHKDISTTQRYAHLKSDVLNNALKKSDSIHDSILNKKNGAAEIQKVKRMQKISNNK